MNWIRILNIVYIILVSVWLGIYIQNLSTTYTWFANLGAPGSALVSYRGTFVDVTIRLTIISHVMIPGIVFYSLINDANKYAFYVFIIFSLLTLLGIVGTGTAYGSCNTYFGNICNDLLYCCKFPGNGCPTVIPCPSIINLGPNETFLGLFWINFVLFLMQLAYIFYVGIYQKKQPKEKIDEPEEEEEEQEKVVYNLDITKPEKPETTQTAPAAAQIGRSLHGLRNKRKIKF